MNLRAASDSGSDRNKKIAISAAIVCFLIGWFHTGKGLESYQILGLSYGGFFLATGVLLVMILAYTQAVNGSKTGLLFYILCAVVTFVCNINSFYPNYRADSLIREELRTHRENLGKLREEVRRAFSDAQLDALAVSIRSKSDQLQAQCRQRGFGPQAEQMLKDIESELGRSITRLRLGKNQNEWDACAEQYAKIIESELNSKLKENRYLDKLEDIRHAEEYYDVFGKKIDSTLADKGKIANVPGYVEDLIKGYRDTCTKVTALLNEEKRANPSADPTRFNISCADDYASPNENLGTFSHTFKSMWSTISDGGTVTVLMIALFIDFFLPIALYSLVHRSKYRSGNGIYK